MHVQQPSGQGFSSTGRSGDEVRASLHGGAARHIEFTEVEKKKNIPFVLTDEELRRLVSILREQITKKSANEDCQIGFLVKYKNGAVVTTKSLDNILAEENHGRDQVVRLECVATNKPNGTESVNVSFSQAQNVRTRNVDSVSYTIKSYDRDWAFVTSSVLEERIDKITPTILRLAHYIVRSSFSAITAFSVPITLIATLSIYGQATEDYERQLRKLQAEAGDTINFIINAELLKRSQQIADMNSSLIPIVAMTITLGVAFYLISMFPFYNFAWGEQKRSYDNKLRTLRWVTGGLILTFIIGIAVNYVSSRLF
jgi:uncharacterized protein (DUF1810 family)